MKKRRNKKDNKGRAKETERKKAGRVGKGGAREVIKEEDKKRREKKK